MTKHLLLIEDNEEVRRQLQWGFFDEPYTVLTAGGVDEALKLQRKAKPQVITLDLGLPPDPEGYSEGLRCLTELLAQCGLDVGGVQAAIQKRWPQLPQLASQRATG